MLLATVTVIPLRFRNQIARRDLQLSMNMSPRSNVVSGIALSLGALVAVFFGVGFLEAGYSYAWGWFPLAAAALFMVVFFAHVARQPFPDLEGDTDSNAH